MHAPEMVKRLSCALLFRVKISMLPDGEIVICLMPVYSVPLLSLLFRKCYSHMHMLINDVTVL